jgi:hypothetical protein
MSNLQISGFRLFPASTFDVFPAALEGQIEVNELTFAATGHALPMAAKSSRRENSTTPMLVSAAP